MFYLKFLTIFIISSLTVSCASLGSYTYKELYFMDNHERVAFCKKQDTIVTGSDCSKFDQLFCSQKVEIAHRNGIRCQDVAVIKQLERYSSTK